MKKYPYCLQLMLLFIATITSGQQLAPSVVASSGGYYSSIAGSLSFTTGELAMIETFESPLAILTQGFQQTFDFGTAVHNPGDSDFSYVVYPNPSDGEVALFIRSTSDVAFEIIINDLLGKEIYRKRIDQELEATMHSIDLSSIAAGTYLVRLIVNEHHQNIDRQFVSRIQIIK